MSNSSVAAVDSVMPAADVQAAGVIVFDRNEPGELKPPLALWIYVARGMGRIILSVLALPFV